MAMDFVFNRGLCAHAKCGCDMQSVGTIGETRGTLDALGSSNTEEHLFRDFGLEVRIGAGLAF